MPVTPHSAKVEERIRRLDEATAMGCRREPHPLSYTA